MNGQRRTGAAKKSPKSPLFAVAALGASALLSAGRPAAADEHMILADMITVPPGFGRLTIHLFARHRARRV